MIDQALLPVESVVPELRAALKGGDAVVLEAPPGAGKTTGVPLRLLDEPWLAGQKILMLEPRRLAARAAAERMAQVLGEPVGERVGYRVRQESRVSGQTRVEVVTEGVLTRMLQQDPELQGVGLLIFDEFHERSLEADLGLALALQSRELLRDSNPLKLLLMSATLDGERVAELLGGAHIVRSAGRAHPVAIRYGDAWRPGEDVCARVAGTVRQALREESGSLLVFLPGQAEIRRVGELLDDLRSERVLVLALHGELDLGTQRQVIAATPPGVRKIVLATAIAETSLTIDGVRVVIDSGLSRLAQFDPTSGMTRLHTRQVSSAAATQRAGRAGRTEPGVCYRLWSATQQAQLQAYTPPEMLQADLLPLALQLLRWGVSDPMELRWLDLPPAAAYLRALEMLQRLGAVVPAGDRWRLTAHGSAMADLPLHPRLAHMLLRARELGVGRPACDLAALLSDRDPLTLREVDVDLRLEWLGRRQTSGRDSARQSRMRQLGSQFARQLGVDQRPVAASGMDAAVLLAFAYPDRIARLRDHQGGYRMSGGRGARLRPDDPLQGVEWLAVAHVGGRSGEASDQIYLAAALDPARFDAELAELVREEEFVNWDRAEGRFVAELRRKVGELILDRRALPNPSAEQRAHALLAFVRESGLELLDWSGEASQLRARVALAHTLEPDAQWPDWSDTQLLQTLEHWLLPAIHTVRRLEDFAAIDVAGLLQLALSWERQQRLNQMLPVRLQVPSGSEIRIDYTRSPPVLAVKLQEMFGCAETPRVAGGRVALMVHLLSPARRPLQVTQDLASFWGNGYLEVRKEMRGRYPKHPWPEDPVHAVATAYTKQRSKP